MVVPDILFVASEQIFEVAEGYSGLSPRNGSCLFPCFRRAKQHRMVMNQERLNSPRHIHKSEQLVSSVSPYQFDIVNLLLCFAYIQGPLFKRREIASGAGNFQEREFQNTEDPSKLGQKSRGSATYGLKRRCRVVSTVSIRRRKNTVKCTAILMSSPRDFPSSHL